MWIGIIVGLVLLVVIIIAIRNMPVSYPASPRVEALWQDEWTDCSCLAQRHPNISIGDFPILKERILKEECLSIDEYKLALSCRECLHSCKFGDEKDYIFGKALHYSV